jgi:hypothetical protein
MRPRLLHFEADIVFHVLQALAFIHASNIAHRVSDSFRNQCASVP